MRLIDADYLTTEIARLVVGGIHAIDEAGHGNFWINGLHDVKKIIDNVPTVEERPQCDFRWTDKKFIDSDGNIRDFDGNIVGNWSQNNYDKNTNTNTV